MVGLITTFETLYSIYFHDWISQTLENGSPQNFKNILSFKIWCYARLYFLCLIIIEGPCTNDMVILHDSNSASVPAEWWSLPDISGCFRNISISCLRGPLLLTRFFAAYKEYPNKHSKTLPVLRDIF